MSIGQIINDVDNRIKHHLRWRRIWSFTYFTSAGATVVSAAFATASAGFITNTGEGKMLTAGLALAATILTSLEKVLKMREKWDLHRNTQIALEIVRLQAFVDSKETQNVVDQIAKISQSYSMQLEDLNEAAATRESGE